MSANPNKRWWIRRLAVDGRSMVPAIEPGDRLVTVRLPVRAGDVIAVRDPREPARVMVKRAVSVDADGRVVVAGDNESESTDSRHFGPVDPSLVVGRIVYRYGPAARAGPIKRGRAG